MSINPSPETNSCPKPELSEAEKHNLEMEREKRRMPTRGNWLASLIVSCLLIVAGALLPISDIEIGSAKFNSNILQVAGIVLLILVIGGPIIIQLIRAWKGGKNAPDEIQE